MHTSREESPGIRELSPIKFAVKAGEYDMTNQSLLSPTVIPSIAHDEQSDGTSRSRSKSNLLDIKTREGSAKASQEKLMISDR